MVHFVPTLVRRQLAAVGSQIKNAGDISSVFVSLSGKTPPPLPPRFADVKRKLAYGNEQRLRASWQRLLNALQREVIIVEKEGSSAIPSIQYEDLIRNSTSFMNDLKRRGVAVVRGVIPRDKARAYKNEIEEYIRRNPSTKAFPAHDPQVFELYWSSPQVRARSHPNLVNTQRLLMKAWHSKDPNAMISTSSPVSYADRVRIRQPGDAGFALGPHVDAGSVERWEDTGYGVTGVYDKIWSGEWEEFDPWESSCRLYANTDLYNGAGACSMFRMFQGWLSMSPTGPKEGTLLVNPMIQLSTAYYLLRPFFRPTSPLSEGSSTATKKYLASSNWQLEPEFSATLQGANPSHSQELSDLLHPHLNLAQTMVHVPKIDAGDYVVWHCDAIHSVDKVHQGTTDSSVLYIPACPLTEANTQYLFRQRETFLQGTPGPDFPGGVGESQHIGRPDIGYLQNHSSPEGLRAMGLLKFPEEGPLMKEGERRMLKHANQVLGFGSS